MSTPLCLSVMWQHRVFVYVLFLVQGDMYTMYLPTPETMHTQTHDAATLQINITVYS